MKVFESAKALLQSEVAKEAMTHMELYRVWTGKQEQVLKFLAKQSNFIEKKIDELVSDTLPGYTITDARSRWTTTRPPSGMSRTSATSKSIGTRLSSLGLGG